MEFFLLIAIFNYFEDKIAHYLPHFQTINECFGIFLTITSFISFNSPFEHIPASPIPPRLRPVSQLYQEGGYTWMTAVTLCLIAVLFSAWKAPNWVREFGRLAMLIGFLSMMVGFYSVSDLIQHTGYPISFTLLCGGLRVAFIAPLYGMIVYGISILVHLALKPRI